MSDQGSITRLIDALDGSATPEAQRDAQQALWDRFFEQLASVARRKLGTTPRRAKDEEDVALSALESFYAGAARGRYPNVRDRHALWPLLVKITARKALNQLRDERAQKRGGGAVRGESVWIGASEAETHRGLAQAAISAEPTPEFAAEVAEECRRLLGRLPDDTTRQIAQLKLEGYTTTEIAARLNMAPRTIERWLQSIRETWSGEATAISQ